MQLHWGANLYLLATRTMCTCSFSDIYTLRHQACGLWALGVAIYIHINKLHICAHDTIIIIKWMHSFGKRFQNKHLNKIKQPYSLHSTEVTSLQIFQKSIVIGE